MGAVNLVAAVIVVASGWASQYAPGKMEQVVRVRQQPGRTAHTLPAVLPPHDLVVAVEDCSQIGNIWLVRQLGTHRWQRALVADCAGDEQTRQWMHGNNILAEIDGVTAQRWDTVGRGARIEIGRVPRTPARRHWAQ